MTRYTFLLNVGFARSGTTAAASFMKNHPVVSVPAKRKELKYFMREDINVDDYISQFTKEGPVLFEASPPYTHRGLEDFRTYMARAAHFAQAGHRVIVIFCIRNLIKRAFSHYWHDISSHYAIYGGQWSCRSTDSPIRFRSLYTKSFTQQVTEAEACEKFLPKCAAMIRTSVDIFGADNVRICHMKELDASLHEISELAGLTAVPDNRSFRIMSASAPRYLRQGDPLWARVSATEAARLENSCLLFSRWHSEILDGKKFDLDRITSAARHWTYMIDRVDLPDEVVTHTLSQADEIAALPKELFLQDAQDALVAELRKVPDRLEMEQISPNRNRIKVLFHDRSQV